MIALRHARIVSREEIIEDGFIVIENNLIKEVGREPIHSGGLLSSWNLENLIVVPGFVDTHTHGIAGIDFTDEPAGVLEAAREYVRSGVTSFLATTVAADLENLIRVCREVRRLRVESERREGSRLLGLHFEGPYVNPEMAGALNPDYIRRPDIQEFKMLLEVCEGELKQITIAPELPGAIDLIRVAASRGITVSIGHTNASYEQTLAGIRAGARKATHIFNAMRRFHHRDPGPSLALIEERDVVLEVIADFIHLHPAVVRFLVSHAGPDRIALITDSIAATGLPDGLYRLGGLTVKVESGIAKLHDKDVLAGSTLTMDKAFRNIISLGVGLREASIMASTTPSQSIGVGELGQIALGFKADLTILDSNYEVIATIIDGEVVYESTKW